MATNNAPFADIFKHKKALIMEETNLLILSGIIAALYMGFMYRLLRGGQQIEED